MAQDGDLDRLLRGEKLAWEGFVRRYAGLVVAAVRGVTRETAEVEDLTQEVFLRLCKDDYVYDRRFICADCLGLVFAPLHAKKE